MELAGAAASMRDRAHLLQNCSRVVETRERIAQELQSLKFMVLPSKTNFLFVRPLAGNAEALYLGLKQRGVLVRHFSKPRIKEHLRISIGTDAEMAVFMDKLQEVMAEGAA